MNKQVNDMEKMILSVSNEIMQDNIDKEVLAIMVRGSYVKKTMTTTSDIDLYAITKTNGPSGEFFQKDSLLFHIRFIPLSYLQWELRRCEPRYLGFVLHGRPIVDPSGIFPALQAIVESLPTQETLQRIPSEGKHQQEDALGQLKAGNAQSSIVLSREAANAYMQTLLFSQGIHCFKKKDIINDLDKMPGFENIKNNYLEIMGLTEAEEKKAEEIFNKTEQLFKELEKIVRDKFGHEIIENPPKPW